MNQKLSKTDGNGKTNKQKIIPTNCIRRSLSSNKPSCENDAAKIQINRETAIANLKILEEKYFNVEELHGFLTNLKIAIGLTNSKGVSEYGAVSIPHGSGRSLSASFSLSNHHSNAETYINKKSNHEYNLRIVVRKSKLKGDFKPHNDVILDEYEYTGKELKKVENALALIIRSIIGFLQTGVYEDLTGIAVRHHSPSNETTD